MKPKLCTGCRRPLAWDSLPEIGRSQIPGTETELAYVLILKNCPDCHSTNAVEEPMSAGVAMISAMHQALGLIK